MFHAFITVFVIITLDNWTDIMFPMMSVSVLTCSTLSSLFHITLDNWTDIMFAMMSVSD